MVQDKARELASEIRNSEEYKNYAAAKERAQANPQLVESLNDYQQKQFELQKKQMLGEEIGAEAMEQMQKLYQILAQDPLAAEYLQAQVRFALMVNDVYGVLADVLK